jgi:hypothetical protein
MKSRLVLTGCACVLALAVAAVAIASSPGRESSIRTVESGPGGEGEVVFSTYVLPGFDPCDPREQKDCSDIVVNEDFLAQLTGDKTIKYPADVGVPECPPPGDYPGLEPDEEIDQETLDAAPECAVHPREAYLQLSMTNEAAAAFEQRFGCGASALDSCTIDDLMGADG